MKILRNKRNVGPGLVHTQCNVGVALLDLGDGVVMGQPGNILAVYNAHNVADIEEAAGRAAREDVHYYVRCGAVGSHGLAAEAEAKPTAGCGITGDGHVNQPRPFVCHPFACVRRMRRRGSVFNFNFEVVNA